MSHGAIQKRLLDAFSGAKKEYRFPSIRRVADVALLSKKIIFEVQCSPISLKDVQNRNRDYASIGFTVVWILHDRIYNKKNASLAELYLRQNLSYYSSITPTGHGFIYDQLDFFQGTHRAHRSAPYIIEKLVFHPSPKLPFFFPKKLKRRPLYFQGDALDILLRKGEGRWACFLERELTRRWTFKKGARELFHSLLQAHASSSHTDRERQNIK